MSARKYRECKFGDTIIHGRPSKQLCKITGRAGKTHFSKATYDDEGSAACSSMSARKYRECKFGAAVIHGRPSKQLCKITGRAGKTHFSKATYDDECSAACSSMSARKYRECKFGDTVIHGRPSKQLCKITGRAGKTHFSKATYD